MSATAMWETTTVDLKVRLPKDIAAQAEEVQQTDPEFLSRVVLYGLTRRSIYRHLREQGTGGSSSTHNAKGEPYTEGELAVLRERDEHQRDVLRESDSEPRR